MQFLTQVVFPSWNYTQEFTNDSNPFGPENVWACGSYTGSSFGVIGGPFAPFSVANQIAQSDFGSGCATANPGGILGIGSPNPPTSDNLPGCFYIPNSAGCTLTGGNDDSSRRRMPECSCRIHCSI